jgi:hypothetical protein
MKGIRKGYQPFLLVKWLGYDDIQLVGTLKNVRDMDKVHDYLRANNMANFIPKKFKTNT